MKQELIKRLKTGVPGLDSLVNGGIPENSLVLLTGSTGTGKTTLAMQFLIEGIRHGEPGIYVSLEEAEEKTLLQMKLLGWPVDEYKAKGMLLVSQPELYDFDKLINHIEDNVRKMKAKRLVLDSVSIISLYFQDRFKVRRAILDLERTLKKLDCTTIAISEMPENSSAISLYEVEEFVVDGVILMHFIRRENVFTRAISIRKMRGSEHSLKIHPLKIKSEEGIVVYPE